MKQKHSIIVAMGITTIAIVFVIIRQNDFGHSPADAHAPLSPLGAPTRLDDGRREHSTQPSPENQAREREKMISLWVGNASTGFALSKKYLIADLTLSEMEAAELDQIFARREAELAALLTSTVEDKVDDRETIKKICALLRNKGLRDELKGILTPEKLALYDANEAAREHDTIEARTYRDLAEISEVVTLTAEQKPKVLAALTQNAAAKVEQEADARAYMTLHYGQMLADTDSSSIRGLSNMVSAAIKNEMPDATLESSHYALWTQTNKSERIRNELNALQQILDEKQLSRYREHLEAEPAW